MPETNNSSDPPKHILFPLLKLFSQLTFMRGVIIMDLSPFKIKYFVFILFILHSIFHVVDLLHKLPVI